MGQFCKFHLLQGREQPGESAVIVEHGAHENNYGYGMSNQMQPADVGFYVVADVLVSVDFSLVQVQFYKKVEQCQQYDY